LNQATTGKVICLDIVSTSLVIKRLEVIIVAIPTIVTHIKNLILATVLREKSVLHGKDAEPNANQIVIEVLRAGKFAGPLMNVRHEEHAKHATEQYMILVISAALIMKTDVRFNIHLGGNKTMQQTQNKIPSILQDRQSQTIFPCVEAIPKNMFGEVNNLVSATSNKENMKLTSPSMPMENLRFSIQQLIQSS
jgi:hypothetical protein